MPGAEVLASERDLLLKLVLNEHLSVAERRRLPFGKARRPVLVEVIIAFAENHRAFPAQFDANGRAATVGMFRDEHGQWQVLRSEEVRLNAYAIVQRCVFDDVRAAAEHLVTTRWPKGIDGVVITGR